MALLSNSQLSVGTAECSTRVSERASRQFWRLSSQYTSHALSVSGIVSSGTPRHSPPPRDAQPLITVKLTSAIKLNRNIIELHSSGCPPQRRNVTRRRREQATLSSRSVRPLGGGVGGAYFVLPGDRVVGERDPLMRHVAIAVRIHDVRRDHLDAVQLRALELDRVIVHGFAAAARIGTAIKMNQHIERGVLPERAPQQWRTLVDQLGDGHVFVAWVARALAGAIVGRNPNLVFERQHENFVFVGFLVERSDAFVGGSPLGERVAFGVLDRHVDIGWHILNSLSLEA